MEMQISREELEGRTTRLRQRMKDEGLDALVIYSDEYRSGHSTYLTSYKPINVIEESPQVVFIVGDLPPVVLVGRLNAYAARDMIWMEDVRPIHHAARDVPEILASLGRRGARIGIVGENLMPMTFHDLILKAAPQAEIVLVTRILMEMREIKSEAETVLMEKAAEINDQVLRELLHRIQLGQSEIQVAAEADYLGRSLGADLGSATVVMSGPNTRYPAWRPSQRVIEPGDFVLVDFNPALSHYCNDGGITFLMPGAKPEQIEALRHGHRIVKEIVPLIRPHTSALTIHDLMLERLEPLGYQDNFSPYVSGQRGVGHGVGLDVVEPPNLSSENDFLLLPGMVLAVKLDLHDLAGGGYRVEVVVSVTESGVHPLNKLMLGESDDFAILQ